MAIGEKILQAIKFRENTEQQIIKAFKAAIEDAKLNGVEIYDIDLTGDVFKAVFNGYEVRISVDAVTHAFKVTDSVRCMTEEGIINTVNELIMKQLDY